MAIYGKLYIDGSPISGLGPKNNYYTVLESEYYITRNIEGNGTASRPTLTWFKVSIIAPEKCRFFYEWLMQNDNRHNGRLDLEVEVKGAHYNIAFSNAYCSEIYESYNARWNDLMVMILYLCPEKVELLDTLQMSSTGAIIQQDGIIFDNKTGVVSRLSSYPRTPEGEKLHKQWAEDMKKSLNS